MRYSFYILLYSVCYYFVKEFFVHVHEKYLCIVFFSSNIFIWLCIYSDTGCIKWTNNASVLFFWRRLQIIYIISSLNVWLKSLRKLSGLMRGKKWFTWNMCCRRALWIPWTHIKANRLVLLQIRTETSLKAKVTNLKLSYFGHTMRRQSSLKRTIIQEK